MPKHRRVVSKPEYLAHHAGKVTLHLGTIVCGLGAILFGTLAFMSGLASLFLMFDPVSRSFAVGFLVVTVILGFGTWLLIQGAIGANHIAEEMTPVVPHTRHAIEQLPTAETLVRASSAPVQDQEQVLLRAAQPVEESAPSELLRPY